MSFFCYIPAVVLLVGALALAITVACFGQLYVRRRFNSETLIAHNEVGGIIIAVAGTLYAVVLGFLTVIAWQHFQDAQEVVVLESNADIDAWHTAVGLPQSVREHVRSDMVAYANAIMDREWPLMKRGSFDPGTAIIGMDAIDAAGSFTPANDRESNAQVSTLQQLTILHDARQRRIGINEDGISWFEWLVLFIGGICIICFCWLFGLRNQHIQLLMTSTVVTIIVCTMVLLFELQYPFRSDVGIGPDAWQYAIDHIQQMQTGEMVRMRM
ncbi:MAG TPA: hypothetical protein VHY79_03185 [Rhizomicrobium sp.]|jgi:hypothetical protein|nr:hypothetical protein [Rhizomicrobium sp.]